MKQIEAIAYAYVFRAEEANESLPDEEYTPSNNWMDIYTVYFLNDRFIVTTANHTTDDTSDYTGYISQIKNYGEKVCTVTTSEATFDFSGIFCLRSTSVGKVHMYSVIPGTIPKWVTDLMHSPKESFEDHAYWRWGHAGPGRFSYQKFYDLTEELITAPLEDREDEPNHRFSLTMKPTNLSEEIRKLVGVLEMIKDHAKYPKKSELYTEKGYLYYLQHKIRYIKDLCEI